MVFSEVDDNWNEHWESLVLISLENIEEVVVLEEAHGSVGDLQVNTTDASNDSLEESWNQVLDLVNFADLQYFLKFC